MISLEEGVAQLLEQCDAEEAHGVLPVTAVRPFLYVSEIRGLLGFAPRPDYSGLRHALGEDQGGHQQ